jgi:hypothetical protein
MPRHNAAITREMVQIRTSFRRLAKSFGRIAPLLAAVATAEASSSQDATRRKPRLSAEQRRALKLQGKYMGTMRGLKPAQRARIKKIRATRGIRAAITAAQRLAKTA